MIEVRGARPEEMSAVLDMIPRVMGATREYFAAAYRNDPWGRAEHSRIVTADGQIVSHLRLYDRWQRVGPVPVHVGCVGDVCTLPEFRKQGHCRALLEDALRYWDAHDYDLSMIVSGVGVYAACGWVTLEEPGFTLAPENRHGADRVGHEIRRFVRGEDLTAVAAVYAAYNAERSLTTVRASAYWEKHFSWIAGEIEEAFLVAEREGQIVAYLRCEGGLRIAEFCYQPGEESAVRPLLDAALTYAAKRRQSGLQGNLPADHPALALVREQPGFAETSSSSLLFRLVNLRRLLERIQPLLAERARAAGVEGALTLVVGEQVATLSVRPGWAAVTEAASRAAEPGPNTPLRVELAPSAFFALLFGTKEPDDVLAEGTPEPARILAALFPRGAPVYWRTDVV